MVRFLGKVYSPNETTVKSRTVYGWTYKIGGKLVKDGLTMGKELVALPQYKHHNADNIPLGKKEKCFEFAPQCDCKFE